MDLSAEARAALANPYADALDAVGFPSSPLWNRLEALACQRCGEFITKGRPERGMCAICAENHPEPDEPEDRGQSFGELYAQRVRGPM